MKRYRQMQRLQRLLTAKHQPPLTLEHIRQALDDCSVSTAKRVIRDLRDFGHPIEYDQERGGYFYDYQQVGDHTAVLPGLFFTESEIRALLTMRRLLSEIQPAIFGKALVPLGDKIEKLLETSGYDVGEVASRIRVTGVARRRVDDFVFRSCADAVLTRKQLQFSYKARSRPDDIAHRRRVSPQRLVYYRDNWYLDAWCHRAEALRIFALEQMTEARLLDGDARNVGNEELDQVLKASYGIFAGEPTAYARLRFTPERSQWVAKEEWHPDQEGRFLEDGSWELVVPYSHPAELVMDVLKHGAEVEIIEPAELRSHVAATLKAAMAMYEGAKSVSRSAAKESA